MPYCSLHVMYHVMRLFHVNDVVLQVAKAPPGTQAAALDWVKAYRCSPILAKHKCYTATFWRSLIWANHCTLFGLCTAGNIQGEVADAFKDILAILKKILEVFKWVDDFDILRYASKTITLGDGSVLYHYSFDLSTIFEVSAPLGIVWHPITEKGHDFAFETVYVGFLWNLKTRMVSLPDKKRVKYLLKVTSFLQLALEGHTVKYEAVSVCTRCVSRGSVKECT